MRAHEFFRFCFFLWSKFNFFCLHLFLIFFFSAPCSMEDFEAETLKCTFFLHKVEINFKFFFTCVVFPSVVAGGFPPLSNQGTPLILSCPIGREQYEEICTLILTLLLRWTFLLFQTSFSLKNKKTRIVPKLISSLCASAVVSSPVWRKPKPPGSHWWPLTWDRTRVAVDLVRSGLLAVAVVNRNA